MSVIQAIGSGLSRTLGAPRVVLGLWLVNLLVALPLGVAVSRSIGASIGASEVERELRAGFSMGWYGEYEHAARGIERSFRPAVAGATAFYDNLEDWVRGTWIREYPEAAGAALLYAVLWMFLLGGVLDRFARPEEATGGGRFARAGGLYFLRFLRLALLSGLVYLAIYGLHRWTFGRLEDLLRDVTRETTVLTASLAGYLLTAFLLTVVHMGFAYAKIATVVEDRRRMLLAALHGFVFVFSHPLRTFGVYYGVVATSAVALGAWSLVAPGVGSSGALAVGLTFLAAQLFLVVRLTLRLTLLGGQTALYRALR